MRAALRRSQVIARERFRRDDEPIVTLDRNEARQKARRQLPVPMADDPYLGEGCIERTHHRVSRGPGDAQMSLFEAANLAVGDWCAEHGLSLTSVAVKRRDMEHVLPP